MRNFKCCLLVMLLAAAVAGCGGGQGKPVVTAVDRSVSEYQPAPSHLTAEQQYLDQLLAKKGYNGNGTKPTVLVVHKLSRKLTVYQGVTPLKTYSVVLGNDPYNDKLCQGDACTPEGVYGIRAKYPHPKWSYFIWLDYPNTQNWLKFSQAKKAGRLSPEADIGGQVGIHGTEEDWKNLAGENWTKGCVSLTNKDIEEIYPLITDKTLVVIRKD